MATGVEPTPEAEIDERPPVGRRLATFALLAALLIALLAAVPGLRSVGEAIGQIRLEWVIAAVLFELASELSFVWLFRLFFDCLPAREGRWLAWTELGSGVLLPGGGAGGLAIGGWLFHLAGVPTWWIIRRSGGLFFLTTAVNAATLIGAGVVLMLGVPGPRGFGLVVLPTVLATAATVVVVSLPWLTHRFPRSPRWLVAIAGGVVDAWESVFRRPSWRLLGAIGYQCFDIAALWAVLRGVGATPDIPALVLAYTIGYLGNAVPIPGSVGALDAGLTGALVLYGVSATHAAAAVLVYHGIALWVPGVGGLYGYMRVRKPILESTGCIPRARLEDDEAADPLPTVTIG